MNVIFSLYSKTGSKNEQIDELMYNIFCLMDLILRYTSLTQNL